MRNVPSATRASVAPRTNFPLEQRGYHKLTFLFRGLRTRPYLNLTGQPEQSHGSHHREAPPVSKCRGLVVDLARLATAAGAHG